MRQITEIIIHCSATPEGRNYTISDIDRWHRERGYKCIGYHYIIYLDGSIHEGRPINQMGAHCVGHNSNSIGVCYIGGCDIDGITPKDTRTIEQKESLKVLIGKLRDSYPLATIHGHNEFANKACPSFNVQNEVLLGLI